MNAFKAHVQNHLDLRFVYPNSECNTGRAVLDVGVLGIPVWPIQGQKIQRRCVGQSSLSDLRQVVVQPLLVVETTEVPLNRSSASTSSFLAAVSSLPTNLTQHMSMQLTRNTHGNGDESPAATIGTLRASRHTLRIPSPRPSLATNNTTSTTSSTNNTSTGTLVTSGTCSQILQYRPHLGESSCFSPVFCAIKDEFVAYYIIEHIPMTLERLMLYDPSALYGNVANTQALTSASGNANDANRNHYSPITARTGGGGSTYFNVPPHSPHSPRTPHNQSVPQSQSPRGGVQSGSPEKKKSSVNSRFNQHGEALKVVPSSPLLTTTSKNPVLHRRGGNSVEDAQTTGNGGSGGNGGNGGNGGSSGKNNIMPGACFGLLRKMDPCMVVGSNVWTGGSLGDLVRVQFLMYQLLSALDVLHGQHLTHGHLRPSNIHVLDLLWLKLFPSKQMLSAGHVTSSSSSSSYNQQHRFPWPSPVVFSVPRHLGHGDIETVTARWCQGDICNLNYLMLLNKAAGRTMGDALFCPVLPWVTDFTTASEGSNSAGNGGMGGQQWCLRDLTKSKFRLNKGDTQLNVTYRSALEHGMMHGVVPHHIPGKYCCCP